MLSKLIKYDFLAMSKKMFPIFLAMLSLTTICSLMAKFRMTGGIIFMLFAILLGILLSASFAITIVYIVLRFQNALLKDEGYLSFALPVKTETHILAKLINSIIWAALEVVTVAICILIMGLIAGSIRDVAEVFRIFFTLDAKFYLSILQILLLMGVELIAATSMFYAAISIAHLFDRHRTLIAAGVVVIILVIRSMVLPTRFFYEPSSSEMVFISPVLYLTPIVCSAIYSLITWYILDKRLNLE